MTDIDFIEVYANHNCDSEGGCEVCEQYFLRFKDIEGWMVDADPMGGDIYEDYL